ncbi:MAG TPA: PAS domain S-box protein [Herpetosiphonaceae bacterium]
MVYVRLNQIQRLALGITLIYVVFASIWIILTDPLIERLALDPRTASILHILQGGIFVFVTSVLLFVLTYREMLGLQRVQQRYHALFEGSQDALFVLDAQGRNLDANGAALKLTGYTLDELRHLNAIDLVPARERERFAACLRAFDASTDSQYVAAHRLQTRAGTIVPIEVSVSPIQFARQQALLCIARDTRRRHEAEAAVRKSEERFRLLIDAAPVAMTLSRDNTTIYTNEAYRSLFGYADRSFVYGTSFLNRVAPCERERIARLIDQRQAGSGLLPSYETLAQRSDGSTFPIHVDVTRIELPDGPAELAFVTDITERKRAEEVIIKSRDFHLSLFEEFPALIWRADPSGECNYFNKTWLAFRGRTLEQELAGWRSAIPAEDLARCREIFVRAFRERSPFETEYRLQRHDGEYRWILDYGRPFCDLDGTFAGYIGACYDITDRKQAAEALREAEERLRTIVASAPITLFAIDRNGVFTFVEGKGRNILAPPGSDLVGQSVGDVYADYPEVYERVRRALGGESFTATSQIGRYTFETHWTPMHGAGGQVAGVIGVAVDVTERQQAQVALQESEANLRAIFDNAYQTVMLLDRDLRVKSYNRFAQMAVTAIYGKQIEIGRPMLEYIPPEDTDLFIDLFNKTLAGTTQMIERPTSGSNGTEWWELYYNPLRTASGEISGVAFTARNITERKRAEEELRRTEEQLRTVIASAPIILLAFDRQGMVTVSEGKALETLGLTSGELVGRSIFEVYHDHPHMVAHAHRALAGEAYTAVVQIEGLTFEMRLAPVRDEDGAVSGVIIVATDITDRQQAEMLLRETEAREQAILNGTSDYVYLKDREGRFLLVNPATARLIGRPADELIGQYSLDVFIPEAADELYRTDQVVLSTGQMYQTEINWTKDGQTRTLLLQKSPHRDAKGQIQGIIGIGRDITDRKRMERALQDARDVYLTLVEEAPMLVWRTDRHGACDFVNKQWLEFTGATPDQVRGNGWLGFVSTRDREVVGEAYTAAWQERDIFEAEFRARRYDGVERWMVTRGTPFFDDHGAFAGYIGTCTDINERKRQEQIKDDFLALASHELRTPLSTLIGYIHLVKRWSTKQQIDARIERALAAMSSESEQLERLINDLLDVSRIQTGRLHIRCYPLDMSAVVRRIIDGLQMVYPEHIFTLDLPGDAPIIVTADMQRIEQVITNLCTNAAKYSPTGTQIEIRLQATDQAVELRVGDQGLGIPAADLPYIFDRFYQVQRPVRESRPGLGLGLFITHEIVRQHNGTITVESVENHGSTFTVRLPIEHKPSEEFSADADPTVHPSA